MSDRLNNAGVLRLLSRKQSTVYRILTGVGDAVVWQIAAGIMTWRSFCTGTCFWFRHCNPTANSDLGDTMQRQLLQTMGMD